MSGTLIHSSEYYPVNLPIFEGPLDLLLFLIQKNEIDIYDIPIEVVTQQYLKILYGGEQINLEAAGDFFVMAATLMYIKSRLLLPKREQAIEEDEADEQKVDPRWELVQQLLQYQQFKKAAEDLGEVLIYQQDFIPRQICPTELNQDTQQRELQTSDKIALWNMFNQVLRRLVERAQIGEIHEEQITVADCMEVILKKLKERNVFMFSSLLPQNYTLDHVIANLLALLELARLKKIVLAQDTLFTDISMSALE